VPHDAEESLLNDMMENWKTDCPKPSGFADINAYRNENELYSTEKLHFLERFPGTNEDLWKEVRLALCPEALVFLSRSTVRLWKKFLLSKEIPIFPTRYQNTYGTIANCIFREEFQIIAEIGNNARAEIEQLETNVSSDKDLTDREISRSMAKGVFREVGTSRNRKLNDSSSRQPM
jgi:hypothetical protein